MRDQPGVRLAIVLNEAWREDWQGEWESAEPGLSCGSSQVAASYPTPVRYGRVSRG